MVNYVEVVEGLLYGRVVSFLLRADVGLRVGCADGLKDGFLVGGALGFLLGTDVGL